MQESEQVYNALTLVRNRTKVALDSICTNSEARERMQELMIELEDTALDYGIASMRDQQNIHILPRLSSRHLIELIKDEVIHEDEALQAMKTKGRKR